MLIMKPAITKKSADKFNRKKINKKEQESLIDFQLFSNYLVYLIKCFYIILINTVLQLSFRKFLQVK